MLKSEDQRGGLTIASGLASAGLSKLAGDWRYANDGVLTEVTDSDPDSDGEGECGGRGQMMGDGFGRVLEGRSESSQPDAS